MAHVNRAECAFARRCKEVLASELKLPPHYFDSAHDLCMCESCCGARGESGEVSYTRGDPPCIYIPARGWFRAALKLPPRALDLDVLRKFHVAFHGTSLAAVPRILRNGGLALPGTRVIGGDELTVAPGHITGQFWRTNPNVTAEARRHTGTAACTSCNGPACPAAGTGNELFCKNQVFMSPSPKYRYAAHGDVYSKWHTVPASAGGGRARVMLQLRVRPGSYTVGPETVSARTTLLDPLVPNSRIEWYTREAAAVLVTGLLIQVDLAATGSGSARARRRGLLSCKQCVVQ